MKPIDERTYHSYMRTVQRQIDHIRDQLRRLPELEKIVKMSYDEWKQSQIGKNKSKLSSIKFNEIDK